MCSPESTPALDQFREEVRGLILVSPFNFLDAYFNGNACVQPTAELMLLLAEWEVGDVVRALLEGPDGV